MALAAAASGGRAPARPGTRWDGFPVLRPSSSSGMSRRSLLCSTTLRTIDCGRSVSPSSERRPHLREERREGVERRRLADEAHRRVVARQRVRIGEARAECRHPGVQRRLELLERPAHLHARRSVRSRRRRPRSVRGRWRAPRPRTARARRQPGGARGRPGRGGPGAGDRRPRAASGRPASRQPASGLPDPALADVAQRGLRAGAASRTGRRRGRRSPRRPGPRRRARAGRARARGKARQGSHGLGAGAPLRARPGGAAADAARRDVLGAGAIALVGRVERRLAQAVPRLRVGAVLEQDRQDLDRVLRGPPGGAACRRPRPSGSERPLRGGSASAVWR